MSPGWKTAEDEEEAIWVRVRLTCDQYYRLVTNTFSRDIRSKITLNGFSDFPPTQTKMKRKEMAIL